MSEEKIPKSSWIRSFETKWFMMPMATGAMGIFTYMLHGRLLGSAMIALGVFFVLLALLMVIVMGAMLSARFIQYPETFSRDTAHPVEVNFLAAVSIALSVTSAGVSRVLLPAGIVSTPVATTLSGTLYLLGMGLGLIFLWLTIYKLTLSENVTLTNAVGIWLLPPVGLFVSIFAGNFWALHIAESGAHIVALFNLLVFGVALLIYIFVMGMIYQRKKFHPLPPAMLAPSFFVPLAPPGVMVIALWSFVALMKKLEIFAMYGTAFGSFSLFLATMMIGFGLFWLVYAVIISWHYGKIPYSLAYWAYVFPLNALGISIALSAAHPALSPLKVLVAPMWFAGLLLWLYVFYKTISALKNGLFSPSGNS